MLFHCTKMYKQLSTFLHGHPSMVSAACKIMWACLDGQKYM